jgi:iron complex transport system permease protein
VTILLSIAAIVLATGIGSVYVSPQECLAIIAHRAFGATLPEWVRPSHVGIVWSLRFPRVLLAFLAGAAISVTGAVMQSILKNPLASSFTLGVSAGASLGAALVILGASIPFLASFALFPLSIPVAGFIFSLASIFLVMKFSRAIDPALSGNTIILAGMVLSLFINAILTLLSALSKEGINRLVYWQMGSFAVKGWTPVLVVAPVLAVCTVALLFHSREMDIMAFSDDEATSIGVPVTRVRSRLFVISSILTGCTIAFTGVIGFIDLAVPHMVRRAVGSEHRLVIPFSFLTGGILMTFADLAARTIIPPLDLPVGAITAIIGAPVFAYIFVTSRENAR